MSTSKARRVQPKRALKQEVDYFPEADLDDERRPRCVCAKLRHAMAQHCARSHPSSRDCWLAANVVVWAFDPNVHACWCVSVVGSMHDHP